MSKPSIYDLLANEQIADVSITNLNSAAKSTFVDATNVNFWSGIITLARAVEESRTYGHGLPIPEASACETVTIADTANGTIKPTGTEIWQVVAIDIDNCSAFLYDGTTVIALGSERQKNPAPFYITSTCYLLFDNSSGSEQTPGIAYHKVGL